MPFPYLFPVFPTAYAVAYLLTYIPMCRKRLDARFLLHYFLLLTCVWAIMIVYMTFMSPCGKDRVVTAAQKEENWKLTGNPYALNETEVKNSGNDAPAVWYASCPQHRSKHCQGCNGLEG
jgi:hypothetical protein